jgi:hypothetical protein
MKKLAQKISPIVLLAFPLAAFAQDLDEFINTLIGLINSIIPLLIAVATLLFIFGVVKYITAGSDEAEVKKARSLIIYGIIGLAVIVGVWGLVNIVLSTFNLDTTTVPNVPIFPTN